VHALMALDWGIFQKLLDKPPDQYFIIYQQDIESFENGTLFYRYRSRT
jgi:hypothetical protein